ncbi:MAG TPA: hypothetical protein EYG92_03860 [Lutibacter sp.]|nr:hypothetical protein [Lutibacter sp.]
MKNQSNNFGLLYKIFGVTGVLLIIAAYFMPIWWVALQSHQYPKSMYPKGIRIEFKYNGVYNGCEGVQERAEITTNEGADCLMEMTAINHYIGMFPIVQGTNSRVYEELKSGQKKQVPEYYVFDTQKDADGEDVIDPETGSAKQIDVTPAYLNFLNGVLVNSKYIFGFLILLAIYFIVTPKKKNSIFAIIPALLPFYFLALYIYSMYWYGHHLDLHGGGAFSGIKPFMPTIFGHGKVAQFETVAYPYWGFGVTMLVFVFFIFANLFKKKALLLQEK